MIKWCLISLAVVALAACGRSAPPLQAPIGGVYTSKEYHFSVTYPSGWQVNNSSGTVASSTIPLEIVITRVNAQASGGAQVSSFTVAVFNAHNKDVAAEINNLLLQAHAAKSTLKPITIGGINGYQDKSVQTTIPGSQITDTHTDYYLLTSNYEYQISIDALSSDNVTGVLQAMLQSFTLLA